MAVTDGGKLHRGASVEAWVREVRLCYVNSPYIHNRLLVFRAGTALRTCGALHSWARWGLEAGSLSVRAGYFPRAQFHPSSTPESDVNYAPILIVRVISGSNPQSLRDFSLSRERFSSADLLQ